MAESRGGAAVEINPTLEGIAGSGRTAGGMTNHVDGLTCTRSLFAGLEVRTQDRHGVCLNLRT